MQVDIREDYNEALHGARRAARAREPPSAGSPAAAGRRRARDDALPSLRGALPQPERPAGRAGEPAGALASSPAHVCGAFHDARASPLHCEGRGGRQIYVCVPQRSHARAGLPGMRRARPTRAVPASRPLLTTTRRSLRAWRRSSGGRRWRAMTRKTRKTRKGLMHAWRLQEACISRGPGRKGRQRAAVERRAHPVSAPGSRGGPAARPERALRRQRAGELRRRGRTRTAQVLMPRQGRPLQARTAGRRTRRRPMWTGPRPRPPTPRPPARPGGRPRRRWACAGASSTPPARPPGAPAPRGGQRQPQQRRCMGQGRQRRLGRCRARSLASSWSARRRARAQAAQDRLTAQCLGAS